MRWVFLLLGMTLVRADLLRNNFWVNPTFELGTGLDQSDGALVNWNRGGNTPTIKPAWGVTATFSPRLELNAIDN